MWKIKRRMFGKNVFGSSNKHRLDIDTPFGERSFIIVWENSKNCTIFHQKGAIYCKKHEVRIEIMKMLLNENTKAI